MSEDVINDEVQAHPPVARSQQARGLLLFFTGIIVLGLVSLVLSVQNAVGLNHQADQRETDRIASDLQSCQRGNVVRQQQLDIGHANEAMITAILDKTFENTDASLDTTRAAQRAQFRAELEEPIAAYRTAVDKITLTDCETSVPGAKEYLAELAERNKDKK